MTINDDTFNEKNRKENQLFELKNELVIGLELYASSSKRFFLLFQFTM